MDFTQLWNRQIEDTDYKWYVLSVVSWQEQFVAKNLKEAIKKNWLSNQIQEVFLPIIKTITISSSWEKKIKEKKLHPGYVYVKSVMNDKIWYFLRNSPNVRLIIWSEIYPTPVSDEEMNKIIEQVKKSEERTEMDVPYKIWDKVKLKEEELWGIEWEIIEIDKWTWNVKVRARLMWRETIVTVWFDKIEKLVI